MAANHEIPTSMPAASYAGITKSKNITTTTNDTVYTNQNNSQYLGIPTGNNFEEIELDRERTLTLETREGEINTEHLHAYLQLLGLFDTIYQNQKLTVNHKQIHEITLKEGVDKQEFKNTLRKHPIIINEKELTIIDNKPYKDLVRVPVIKVIIYEAPYELQDKHILAKLGNYGVLSSQTVFSHKHRGTEIYNGVRSISFKSLNKAIPTTMFVRGNRIRLRHENQDRSPICGLCKQKGHFRLECRLYINMQKYQNHDQEIQEIDEEEERLKEEERRMKKEKEKKEKERLERQKEEEEQKKKREEEKKRKRSIDQTNNEEEKEQEFQLVEDKKKKKRKEKKKKERKERAERRAKGEFVTSSSNGETGAEIDIEEKEEMSEGDVERAKSNYNLFNELVRKRKEDEEDQMTTDDEREEKEEKKKEKIRVVKHGKMIHSCQVSDPDLDSDTDGVPDSYPTPGQKDWGEEMDALDKCLGEK